MPDKSPTQRMLEAQRQKSIRDIVVGTLESHRGRKNLVMAVALDLGVSDVTVYRWCEDLGINVDDYRHPIGPTAVVTHQLPLDQAIEGEEEPLLF